MIDEQDILLLVKQGSFHAFEQLYAQYSPRLQAYFYKLLGSSEKAQEMTQELFSRLWEKRGHYKGKITRPEYYILTIARNIYLKSLRHHTTSMSEVASHEPGPQEVAINGEQSERLINALGELSPEIRETICLVYYAGLAYDEISNLQNISYATVKWRVAKALDLLRTLLLPYFTDRR
jgi:RNA polymerase sigma-70 factor (ECF subfamily)